MKVFVGLVAITLAVGSVSSLGSGPYLPSGWRPKGPAFFLPGEVQKPVLVAEPIKEIIVFDTEASGSDSLREYGPPVQVSENLISQGLPDAVTDQIFLVADSRGSVNAVELKAAKNIEQTSELVQEQTTEAITEERTVEYESIADIKLQADVTTAINTEEVPSETEVKSDVAEVKTEISKIQSVIGVNSDEAATEVAELNSEVAKEISEGVEATTEVVQVKAEETEEKSAVGDEKVKPDGDVQKTEEITVTSASVEKLEQAVIQEVEVAVKNIAEVLVNLENDIKSKQVQSETIAIAEVKTDSGSAEVPEGFLEYGPPGFKEYGPPKGDELLNSAAIQEPSNEVRRRRFSPKFRAPKNKRLP